MQEDRINEDHCEVGSSCNVKFFPSMSNQRYCKVVDILTSSDIELRKVVDFGCSDLNFFRYLKRVPKLQEIAVVDVNLNVLETNLCKTAPLLTEYLVRRFDPLKVLVYNGSVAELDHRLLHYDAVSCIELVEHLTVDVLEKFPMTIFGFIRPKLAVITTPNADFNVLFPDMKGFRHWDHKFEWTRQQFTQWCQKVVAMYPSYTFETMGVGNGPPGSEDLGCCSQVAVFKLNENVGLQCHAIKDNSETNTPYILLPSQEYPYESLKDTLIGKIKFQVNTLSSRFVNDAETHTDTILIPVDDIFSAVSADRSEFNNEHIFSQALDSCELNLIFNNGKQYVEYRLDRNSESEPDF